MGEGITSRQLRAVWALSHRAGLKEEDLRSWVESLLGKSSIRSLTKVEAGKIIEGLLLKGGQKAWGSKKGIEKEGVATRAQIAFITGLSTQTGWDQRRLLGLAQKMYGVSQLIDLKIRQASGLIEAIKSIGRRHAA